MTYEGLYRQAIDELKSAGVPEAELSAWYLLEYSVGDGFFDRAYFYLHGDDEVSDDIVLRLGTFVEYRKKRVPLEYITHRTQFMGLDFYVDADVLIPRQDTETLVCEALKFSAGRDVLDICTGSGCIAVSIAGLGRPESVTASDKSLPALSVAKKNAAANNADIEFVRADIWDEVSDEPVSGYKGKLNKRFDLIISNPPYIRRHDMDLLMPEVKEYEPVMALDGGEDGLFFYKKILDGIKDHIRPDGIVLFEIGFDQAEDVSELMRSSGLDGIEVIRDLAGKDRVVRGGYYV
ncbi:MAG: peptide chain release factor N(5)-glutamine methyltransferase [Eubacterium sp.]|nr:peptide chain release factor N(5)-glutamine methyltransferase [Eubacterium sp.]